MHPTKNDLPEKVRAALETLLNARLADSIDLQLHAKQAHWNVKGPQFLQLHALFDETYTLAGAWSDLMAERVVALGGTALGTKEAVVAQSTLPVYGTALYAGRAHVDALSSSLAALGAAVRKSISAADALGDADTVDLFTEISRAADKQLWLLEAHLLGEG